MCFHYQGQIYQVVFAVILFYLRAEEHMAVFTREDIITFGSIEDFAEFAGCSKVYRLADGIRFIGIQNQQEEYDMVLDPDTMEAEMVYCRGIYVPFNWGSLFLDVATGSGSTAASAEQAARANIKPGGNVVGQPRVVKQGAEGVREFEAFSPEELKSKWMEYLKNPEANYSDMYAPAAKIVNAETKVVKVECVRQPQNSFLAKKPGLWRIYWQNPWEVEITYQMPIPAQGG
jgi:hypothetical protein